MDVRRAADRAVTWGLGVELRHALSAGHHYDPTNTSYGPLVAHDEIVLAPGAGFATHRHRDLEIVTWVLEGELVHEDELGPPVRLGRGSVQVLHAGGGVQHAETAGPEGARFVQAWLLPEVLGGPPSCSRSAPVLGPDLTPLAGPGSALTVGCAAVLHVGRPPVGSAFDLPAAQHLHLHVARGEVVIDEHVLQAGDALRRDGGGGRLEVRQEAELLVWAADPAAADPAPLGPG